MHAHILQPDMLCHVQGASMTSLEILDGVHLINDVDDSSEEGSQGEGVRSLARFTALRSLALRRANGSTMFRDTPVLPSGLRCGLTMGCAHRRLHPYPLCECGSARFSPEGHRRCT